MRYLVCRKQEGVGCDYTIGCGMNFEFVEADSLQQVIDETIFPYGKTGDSVFEDDNPLKEFLIVPARYVTKVNLNKIANEIKQVLEKNAAIEEEKREIKLYKKLKEKYEDNV